MTFLVRFLFFLSMGLVFLVYSSSKGHDSNICNCRNKDSCPLNGKCLQENVVYKATITTKTEVKKYIESTGGTFKKRWYGHISDKKIWVINEQSFPNTFGN